MRASVLREDRMVYRDDVPDPVPGTQGCRRGNPGLRDTTPSA